MPYTNLGSVWSNLGQTVGSGIGSGISKEINDSLDLLKQEKLADMLSKKGINQQKLQKDYDKQQLSTLFGNRYAPEVLDFLASMPQQNRYSIISTPGALDELQNMFLNREQIQQQPEQLQQMQQQPQQQSSLSPMQMLSAISGQQQPEQLENLLQQNTPAIPAQMQQQMPVQTQQPQKRTQLQNALFGQKQTDAAQERLELSKEKELTRQQERLRPIINAELADHKHIKKIGNLAREMLKNIEEHRDQFPGMISSTAQELAQGYATTNPYVRKFRDNGIELASLMTAADKGQPTNMKMKLKQMQKPNISKPFETNVAELQDLINQAEQSDLMVRYMDSLKDKHGRYPLDLGEKLSTYGDAMDKPLLYPDLFPAGMSYVDDNDNEYVLKETSAGKKWEEVHG